MEDKNLKHKAFTLLELLAVIVILAIFTMIAVPSIMHYFKKGQDTYNDKLREELVIAGKTYYSENQNNLPLKNGESRIITVKEMQTQGLISKNFVDSDGNDCSDSKVKITRTSKGTLKYTYIGCLECKTGKIHEGEKCQENYIDSRYDYSLCKLTVKEDKVVFNEGDFKNIEDYAVVGYTIDRNKTATKNSVLGKKISDFQSIPGDILYGHVMIEFDEEEFNRNNTNNNTDRYQIIEGQNCIYKDPRITCKFQNTPTQIFDTKDIFLKCTGNDISQTEAEAIYENITLQYKTYNNINITEVTNNTEKQMGTIRNFKITYTPKKNIKVKETMKSEKGFLTNTIDGKNNESSEDTFEFIVNTAVPTAIITVTGEKEAGGYLSPSVTTTRTCISDKNNITDFTCKASKKSVSCGDYSTNTKNKIIASSTTTETTHSKGKTFSVKCKNVAGSHTAEKKVKIDAGDPKISMSTNKSKVSGASWYKVSSSNKLEITFKCSDSLSGMKSIVVKNHDKGTNTTDTTTVTKKIGGAHKPIKFTVTCKDKVENKSTKAYSFYTKVKSEDNICECKTTTCSTCYSYYWTGHRKRPAKSTGGRHCGNCNATAYNNLGGSFWCTYSNGKTAYEKQCTRYPYSCNCICSKRKSCWHY